MELLGFFFDQFKVPIIGLTVLGLLIWIRVFIRPLRRVRPPGEGETSADQGQKRENLNE